jgi:predicted transposase YbfD/YdcC
MKFFQVKKSEKNIEFYKIFNQFKLLIIIKNLIQIIELIIYVDFKLNYKYFI